MATPGECLLGLCAVVFVCIRTGSGTEQMNLAALLRRVSSGTSIRDMDRLPIPPWLHTAGKPLDGSLRGGEFTMPPTPELHACRPASDPSLNVPRRWGGGVLNVFVPLSVNLTSPLVKPLPVMVWIHGGDFIAGSASKPLYDSRYISNFTHTVVVSVAYRKTPLVLTSVEWLSQFLIKMKLHRFHNTSWLAEMQRLLFHTDLHTLFSFLSDIRGSLKLTE